MSKKLLVVLALAGACLWAQDSAATPTALSPAQKQAIQQRIQTLENDTKAKAEQQSAKVAAIAKDIDRNILSGKPDEALDRKLSADFTAAVGQMVNSAVDAKLAMVREVVKVLTPAQRATLLAEVDKPGANPDLAELIGKVFGGK